MQSYLEAVAVPTLIRFLRFMKQVMGRQGALVEIIIIKKNDQLELGGDTISAIQLQLLIHDLEDQIY